MSVYLAIAIGVIPALAVFFGIIKIYGRRLGDLHQWVADLRARQDRLEKEVGEIAVAVKGLRSGEPRAERLGKQLGQLAVDLQNERQALEERLKKSESTLSHLESRFDRLRPGAVAAPALSESAAVKGLASPVVREVLELSEQGVDAASIARRTGLQLGEVDLIRSLHTFAHKEQPRP